MIIKDIYFDIKKLGPCANIYCMPDCHFGSPAFLESEYERLAEIIENDPLAYLIFQGDLLDSNRPSTRELKKIAYNSRGEEQQQEDDRNAFWIDNKIIPRLKRLVRKGRCMGMLDGDHYMLTESGMSTTQAICIKMGFPYLGNGQSILKLHFGYVGRQTYTLSVHCQHGIGGCGRIGNGVNKLEDMSNIFSGIDVFIRGHSHKGFLYPISKYYNPIGTHEIKQKDIWLVNTPSFRTGIVIGKTDYAESANYGATAHKFPVLHISATKGSASNRNLAMHITGELL